MKYIEVNFKIQPSDDICRDVLSSLLGDVGYTTFVETEEGISAYIQDKDFSEEEVDNVLADFPLEGYEIQFERKEVEGSDWNSEWEDNGFKPIISDKYVIHSSKSNIEEILREHEERLHEFTSSSDKTTKAEFTENKYDIIINPKMSFGSGSHETTRQLADILIEEDFSGKNVLDMGCGTFILGIIASIKGANHVTGIDIDEFCIDNSRENCEANNISNFTLEHGDASCLTHCNPFDAIIANIHKNILINDMDKYCKVLKTGGKIWMSGFFTDDIEDIISAANKNGLTFSRACSDNNWAVTEFIKQ